MAVAYRASTSGHSSSTTSVTVTKPTGTVDGDYILVALGWGGTVDVPAGWTLVATMNAAWVVLGRIASGEGASWGFTTDTSTAVVWNAVSFSGVDQTTPYDVSAGGTDTSGTSVVAPTITTTRNNTMLLGIFGVVATTTLSTPSGMTEAQDYNGGGGRTMSSCYESFPTAGATGTRTATAGVSGNRRGALIAINEAVAASVAASPLLMCYP